MRSQFPLIGAIRVSWALVVGFAGLLCLPCHADPPLPCGLTIEVFGPWGDRLDARIATADPLDPANGKVVRPKLPVLIAKNRVHFDRTLLNVAFRVRLEVAPPPGGVTGGRRTTMEEVILVCDCDQRDTVQIGQPGAKGVTAITGRLSGVGLDEDHWIRAIPMFGAHGKEWSYFDGAIDLKTGAFRIPGVRVGIRYAVVAGRAETPLGVFGVNVMKSGEAALGQLDIGAIRAGQK